MFSGKIRPMKINLALAQINTKLGDVEANLAKHLDYIKQAKSEKTDLLVFPELSLTGYVLQDLVASAAHQPTEDDPIFKHLFKASHDLDLVVGFVDEDSRPLLHCFRLSFRRETCACSSQSLPSNLRPLRRRSILRLG